MRNTGALLTTLFLATLGQLSGQQATLVGVVTDSLTGNTLADAYVHLPAQDITALTGSDGKFRLGGVASGDLTIEVRKPGFEPEPLHVDIEVIGAVTVDLGTIALAPLVVELDPIVVEDREVNQRLNRVGFYRRMNTEHGTFLTREEIARLNPSNTSELVARMPAFGATLGGAGNVAFGVRGTASIRQANSACLITYYVDGVRAEGAAVDEVLPNSIEAMEAYAGPATIPPQFRTFPGNPNCGAVILWTRTGRRRPER